MDRNQAKALLPIIQAYAEGKEIEIFDCTKKMWETAILPHFDCDSIFYRIKPETAWKEMLKHKPFGWLKSKEATEDVYFTITGLTNDTHGAMLNSSGGWSFSGLFDYYTFADGTPFGVKVE